MKKILYILVFVISFLCFTNSINAKVECTYNFEYEENKGNLVSFKVSFESELVRFYEDSCQYGTTGNLKECETLNYYPAIPRGDEMIQINPSVNMQYYTLDQYEAIKDLGCPPLFINETKSSDGTIIWWPNVSDVISPDAKKYIIYPEGYFGNEGSGGNEGSDGNENIKPDLVCKIEQGQGNAVIKDFTIELMSIDGKYYYTMYRTDGSQYVDRILFHDGMNYTEYTSTIDYYGTRMNIFLEYETRQYYYELLLQGKCPSEEHEFYIYGSKDITNHFSISHIKISSEDPLYDHFGDALEYSLHKHIYALRNPLAAKLENIYGSDLGNYKASVWGESKSLQYISNGDEANYNKYVNLVCEYETCKANPDYYLNMALTNTMKYCAAVFAGRSTKSMAFEDCISFKFLYKNLILDGIIEDTSYGCVFVSNELGEKLIWILDLLKIVGPIAALGLGTLDFIKAFASGDADKELKTAFKRFSTRIIAAVLLFVIPFILAFLMDTFLGNEEGYNPDNPFCNIVEWE